MWPYKDTRGNTTWGIGHNLSAAPLCLSAAGFLGQAIQAQFDHDLDQATSALATYPWYAHLDLVRQAALQNMVFNLGAETFSKFAGFRGYMASGDYSAAAADLRTTLVYKQLSSRYERLAKQIETGIEQ